MGKADWNKPRGHWIDARNAFYVIDSRAQGAMGATIGTFASKQDAQAFGPGLEPPVEIRAGGRERGRTGGLGGGWAEQEPEGKERNQHRSRRTRAGAVCPPAFTPTSWTPSLSG